MSSPRSSRCRELGVALGWGGVLYVLHPNLFSPPPPPHTTRLLPPMLSITEAARWLTAAPCATDIKPSTGRLDGGKKSRARRAASERALLESLHHVMCDQGAGAYDPVVLAKLSSVVKSHVREVVRRASKFSAHRNAASSDSSDSRCAVGSHDLQVAVRSWGLNRMSHEEENAMARRQAAQLNKKPLKRIKTVFGMQVPSESRTFLSEEYVVTVVEDETASRKAAAKAEGDAAGDGEPVNRGRRQRKRKRHSGIIREEAGANNKTFL